MSKTSAARVLFEALNKNTKAWNIQTPEVKEEYINITRKVAAALRIEQRESSPWKYISEEAPVADSDILVCHPQGWVKRLQKANPGDLTHDLCWQPFIQPPPPPVIDEEFNKLYEDLTNSGAMVLDRKIAKEFWDKSKIAFALKLAEKQNKES